MKLLEIRNTPILVDPLDGEYYRLRKDAEITMVTDEGTYHDYLGAGWITDLRSGSSFIDHFIPKWDGPESPYSALIAFHDSAWSGWVPRKISDEILAQGCVLTHKCSERVSQLVKFAVDHFGTHYDMEDRMPKPYTLNRYYEKMELSAR